jgi:hypothetical protein
VNILTFSHVFDTVGDTVYFAYCYPYTYTGNNRCLVHRMTWCWCCVLRQLLLSCVYEADVDVNAPQLTKNICTSVNSQYVQMNTSVWSWLSQAYRNTCWQLRSLCHRALHSPGKRFVCCCACALSSSCSSVHSTVLHPFMWCVCVC